MKKEFDLEHSRLKLWQNCCNSDNWQNIQSYFDSLCKVEFLWAYPGPQTLDRLQYYITNQAQSLFYQLANNCLTCLQSGSYLFQYFIPFTSNLQLLDKPILIEQYPQNNTASTKKPYFEVLVIHPNPKDYLDLYKNTLSSFKTDKDEFLYDLVFVDNAEDALTAILANTSIQSVVFVPGYKIKCSDNSASSYPDYKPLIHSSDPLGDIAKDPISILNKTIKKLRSELDLYLITDTPPQNLSPEFPEIFNRILFHINPFLNLHHTILNGVRNRYSTPFFHALQAYARKPKGSFHALPLSRAKSIKNSHWINDLLAFYGENIFLAETSSTQGGLDSLLDPKGAIKQAHDKVAETFGSKQSYFVTNGTSTSNKIVMQTTLKPDDIVLISSDCHKSIAYAAMLSGAHVIFLTPFTLPKYDLYGAVLLKQIKSVMLDLKKNNQLHRLKQLSLTNSTFDGLIYNTEKFMTELLAIKSDLIFHWDEAWFAFAHFSPLYQDRTAMRVANKLNEKFKAPQYKDFYKKWKTKFTQQNLDNDSTWLDQPLHPDPENTTIRVYATQSTHKTLTSFRQGSMIHIFDTEFDNTIFLEAYRMHSSTSPNYQIIASLDVGRRQVALEGYEKIKNTLYLASNLRKLLDNDDQLSRYFTVLNDTELVPGNTHNKKSPDISNTYADLCRNWKDAEFVVDPTRVLVDISKTGMNGPSFRHLLMDKYDIQVNKTSQETVLFIVNIGSTPDSITYLINVLKDISEKLNLNISKSIPLEKKIIDLPQKRYFHKAFKPVDLKDHDLVDIRLAYFHGYDKANTEYVPLDKDTLKEVLNDRKLVSATFATPYPPGFPVLVPGQIITYDILQYLQHMKIKEIHGYQPALGLKIFTQPFLDSLLGAQQ
jgi:arginine decarboxylase